jgi:hemolysin activation/secretion protein
MKWIFLLLACMLFADEVVLKSLCFVPSMSQFPARTQETGISFCDMDEIDQRRAASALSDVLEQPISSELLDEIRTRSAHAFREQGFPVVGVSIPAGQDITDGHVTVVAQIARLDSVRASGSKWFSNEKLAKMVTTQSGEMIRSPPLMSDLNWINSNPFRSASIVYSKGADLGQTNIDLVVKDRFPLRVYVGYENNGNIVAGNNREYAGFDWGDVFFSGHQLNYQFISAAPVKDWWGHVLAYVAPLPWRHTWKVYGSYVQVLPNLNQEGFTPFQSMKGRAWQMGTRYNMPLPSIPHYRHQLVAGYDFKRTNNFLAFSDALLFNQYFDVSQFVLGYEGILEGSKGLAIIGAQALISPGNMTDFNTSAAFDQERPGANSQYIYGMITLDSLYTLPLRFSWAFTGKVQFASGKLLPTEELSVGGYTSVRGYDENEVISDAGLIVRNELRTPDFSPSFRKIPDEVQFLAFCDFGYAVGVDPSVLPRNHAFLASVGPGIRYKIQDYFSLRLDYGFELHRIHDRPFAPPRFGRFHFGSIASF